MGQVRSAYLKIPIIKRGALPFTKDAQLPIDLRNSTCSLSRLQCLMSQELWLLGWELWAGVLPSSTSLHNLLQSSGREVCKIMLSNLAEKPIQSININSLFLLCLSLWLCEIRYWFFTRDFMYVSICLFEYTFNKSVGSALWKLLAIPHNSSSVSIQNASINISKSTSLTLIYLVFFVQFSVSERTLNRKQS